MNSSTKLLLLFLSIFFISNSSAQSGGPPMITDDPGVVDFHKFEINTSINSTITKNQTELSVPYIDANYGIANHLQLKIEFPYNIVFEKNKKTTSAFGDVLIGLKIKFFDEEKYFLSAGTYPQWTATGNEKGFLIPLLFEKTFGNFLIGEDIGFFFGENNHRIFNNGFLLGYKVSKNFEIMGEYFLEKQTKPVTATDGYANYGFRYALNSHINLMGSFGTQLVTSAGNDRQIFFSWLGIQTDF